MEKVHYQQWPTTSYAVAWDRQQELLDELVARKRRNRGHQPGDAAWEARHHYLIFCDHPHVYTLGKSGSEEHLLLNEQQRAEHEVEYFRINRGGDITYHGPGQIVGYPIFDLEGFFTDVHKYVRFLEEAVMRTLADYGLTDTYREQGYTGVWLPATETLPKRKICAIGVHLSRWCTMHGFAFNVNTDLSYFGHIVPCGIAEPDRGVTSMAAELGHAIDMDECRERLLGHFAELFGFEVMRSGHPVMPDSLEAPEGAEN